MNKKIKKEEIDLRSLINQCLVMIKYSFTNYFRSRRFFVMFLITLIIGTILTVFVAYYRPQSYISSDLSFYSNWWGNSITFIVILSAIFFGGDAISSEFENKTGYFILVNPITRPTVYFGKLIAAILATFIIVSVFAVITIANAIYYFGSVNYLFFESFGFSIIYIFAVMGLAFFFSSLFKNNSTSIIVTIILFLFVFPLIQTLIASLVGIEPWFIVTYGAQIIGNVFQNPYPAHVSTIVLHSPKGKITYLHTYNPTIKEGIYIMLSYFVGSALAGLLVFQKREFN